MAEHSSIEWTDATWNIVTGCTEVSPGCDHCYAKTFAERWRGTPGHHFENGFDVTLRPERLELPFKWRKPRRVFVNSMSDLFHDAVPDEFIARVFAVMSLAPEHTFQVLTKRHARMRALLNSHDFVLLIDHALRDEFDQVEPDQALRWWPLANVWLGVSAETQQWADIRIPALLDTPAAMRFISAEPLLGPVDIDRYLWLTGASTAGPFYDSAGRRRFGGGAGGQAITYVPSGDLHWVIVGGESGPGARPMSEDWARFLVDQCQHADVPVFVKQMGSAWARGQGYAGGSKGGDPGYWPADLRVREFPDVTR